MSSSALIQAVPIADAEGADVLPGFLQIATAAPATDPVHAALACGRVLRAGALVPRAVREKARRWLEDCIDEDLGAKIAEAATRRASNARELLAAVVRERDGSSMAAILLDRDDGESLLVALGVAMRFRDALAPLEARTRAALESLDRFAEAFESELAPVSGRVVTERWLAEVTVCGADGWWLRLVSTRK